MTWPYHYTPYTWPMLASAAFMGALALYAWRRRSTPGAISFTILMLIGGLWALGSALQVSALDSPRVLLAPEPVIRIASRLPLSAKLSMTSSSLFNGC